MLHRKGLTLLLSALALPLAVTGCDENLSAPQASGVNGANWATGGANYNEQHFSPRDAINTQTVSRLGLAWSLDLEDETTLEATPIAVDGILYFSGQMATVYAVDAVTGTLLWRFDPKSYEKRPEHQRLIFAANRGVAYWDGMIFVGTLDGRLIGLDAKTGQQRWSVMTLDPASKAYIAGAPRAYNGKVIIGNGGGDYGERGFVTAYDARSGRQLWRFHTAPGDPAKGFENDAMRMAAKTWRGEYWKTGTGGTVWNGITFDAEMNRLYIGTGNSGPYDPEIRSPGGGDNLFLASIVALDADTGKYIWHYQVNPREAWDYKATANITLTTLTIGDKPRRVLMQSPTNGFFYVIDRETGRLISAEKTGKVTWALKIDLATGRPVDAPNIRYENGPVTFWPSPLGTHNWQPMSYSPATGLVYIPYMQAGARFERVKGGGLLGSGTAIGYPSADLADKDDGTGALLAWDPVAQKARWKVRRSKTWNGGVLSTAGGLVFQGDADGQFEARDAASGQLRWNFDAKLGIIAAPISFAAKGKQYVSVLVGFGGSTGLQSGLLKTGWKYGLQPRRLLTFTLNGKAVLPPTPPPDFTVRPLNKPGLRIDQAAARLGEGLYYSKNCALCHGVGLKSAGGSAPHLVESGIALDEEALGAFLTSGARVQVGMPAYPELSKADVRGLYMFIRDGARKASAGEQSSPSTGVASRM